MQRLRRTPASEFSFRTGSPGGSQRLGQTRLMNAGAMPSSVIEEERGKRYRFDG